MMRLFEFLVLICLDELLDVLCQEHLVKQTIGIKITRDGEGLLVHMCRSMARFATLELGCT